MRRLVLVSVLLGALSVPTVALGVPAKLMARTSPGDGTLVVQDAQAPNGVAAVKLLKFTGTVIGQVQGIGKIKIDAGPNGPTPLVTGAGNPRDVPTDKDGTAQQWGYAEDFKFRAVGGTFTIVIYGSDVSLVAIGTGSFQLTGMPDTPKGDGKYSLNGADWKSLPGTTSDWTQIGSNG